MILLTDPTEQRVHRGGTHGHAAVDARAEGTVAGRGSSTRPRLRRQGQYALDGGGRREDLAESGLMKKVSIDMAERNGLGHARRP